MPERWAVSSASARAQQIFSRKLVGSFYLLVILVVVYRGDGVEHLLVVVVHAEGVASL